MMKCRKCGSVYDPGPGRVPFRARCRSCDTALHVCVQCAHYDIAAYNGCREPQAERVVEKERENRCEYFTPVGDAGNRDGTSSAKKAFDDLFR